MKGKDFLGLSNIFDRLLINPHGESQPQLYFANQIKAKKIFFFSLSGPHLPWKEKKKFNKDKMQIPWNCWNSIRSPSIGREEEKKEKKRRRNLQDTTALSDEEEGGRHSF